MFDFIYNFVTHYVKLSGVALHIVSAAVFAFFVMISVIAIGLFVNEIEKLQFKFLRKFFSQKTVFFICNYVTCVGIFIHELSHALFAFLSGAKVTKISLLEVSKNSNRLGHVEFKTCGTKRQQYFQLSFASCAPVITGCLFLYIFLRVILFHPLPLYVILLSWYIIISVVDHMSMSGEDIRNYLKGMIVLYPMITFVAWIIFYFLYK